MTRESSGMNFCAGVFKFYADINVFVIFICVLEHQRVRSILNIFPFIYILKFSNFLQLREDNFKILRNNSTLQICATSHFLKK
jgi:hypothetical protein